MSVVAPDGATVYVESKAAGLSNQTFVYAGRVAKDRAFVAAGHRLWYAVWHHAAATKDAGTEDELRALVGARMLACYLAPFAAVAAIVAALPEEKLNSSYGQTHQGDRRVYGSGYRIPVARLGAWRAEEYLAGVGPARGAWPLPAAVERLGAA